MNIFRLAGDLCHVLAILILLFQICKTRSCAGISGKSQILLGLVYITRYLDIFTIFSSLYNSVMKIMFVGTSVATIYLMYVRFKDTKDTDNDSLWVEFLLIPCAVLALVINHDFTIIEVLWTFSVYLESVAILPQFFLMRRIGKAEPKVSYYLFAMGSYRALYLLNWAYRYYFYEFYDLIAIFAGVVQTILYCGFFCFCLPKLMRPKNFAENLTISPLPPISIIGNLKEKEASQINV